MLTRNRMSLCIQSLVLVEWDVVEANKSFYPSRIDFINVLEGSYAYISIDCEMCVRDVYDFNNLFDGNHHNEQQISLSIFSVSVCSLCPRNYHIILTFSTLMNLIKLTYHSVYHRRYHFRTIQTDIQYSTMC